MNGYIVLSHLQVENANAIAGFTYGFPSITGFQGFKDALSREFLREHNVSLGDLGVVSHKTQVHAQKSGYWRDYVFSLTRNPLKKDGKTASFNEEGRMSMEISLVIECLFEVDDLSDEVDIVAFVKKALWKLRVCGGMVTSWKDIYVVEPLDDLAERKEQLRALKKELMPGFALVDRTDIYKEHCNSKPQKDKLESLLDLLTVKEESVVEGENVIWKRMPRALRGWLVPIMVGYKRVSKLYAAGTVKNVKDNSLSFAFVEPVYSLGEWLSIHRINKIEQIFWKSRSYNDFYINKGVIK